jgi:hypothetical protein
MCLSRRSCAHHADDEQEISNVMPKALSNSAVVVELMTLPIGSGSPLQARRRTNTSGQQADTPDS